MPGFEGASAFARLDHHAVAAPRASQLCVPVRASYRVRAACGMLACRCLHANAGRSLPAARTVVFAKPCGLARATYKAHERAQQTRMSVVSSPRSAVTSPTPEESNRSLVHTANAHHPVPDAAASGAAVATSLPAVFFSMP